MKDIDAKLLKQVSTVAGVISIIMVAYYVTGLYRNVLQIKKLKTVDSKPLNTEDL